MKELQGCSTPFPASAASPALPARGTGLRPRSLRGGAWGLRLSAPPHCALGMRQEQRRAAGIWDTAAGPPGPWTLKSHPAVSTLPPGSALAAAEIYGERRGRRASGSVNKRRVCTLSPAPGAVSLCHAAPRVPPGSSRPRTSHPNRHRDPTPRPRAGNAPGAPSGSESLINRELIAWKTSHLSHAVGGAAWGPEWLPPPWGRGVTPPGRAEPTPCTGTPPVPPGQDPAGASIRIVG